MKVEINPDSDRNFLKFLVKSKINGDFAKLDYLQKEMAKGSNRLYPAFQYTGLRDIKGDEIYIGDSVAYMLSCGTVYEQFAWGFVRGMTGKEAKEKFGQFWRQKDDS